jgi:hypothetical protein
MGTFYSLENAAKSGEIVASLHLANGIQVENYNQIHRAEITPERLIGKIEMGSKLTYDVACADGVTPILFSAKFFSVLESIGATGYKKCPITLIDKKSNLIDGFSALQVMGRSGAIDRTVAKAIAMPPPSPKGKPYVRFIGFRIDESGWDGSDFFVPEGTRMVIITEKVAQALKAAKLNNVSVTRTTDQGVYFSKEDIVSILGQTVFDDLKAKGLI